MAGLEPLTGNFVLAALEDCGSFLCLVQAGGSVCPPEDAVVLWSFTGRGVPPLTLMTS